MKSEPRYRWMKVRSLFEPRALPTCTRLVDGRVRVDGGSYYDVHVHETRVAQTEIYAPDEDRWTKGDVDVPAVAPPIAKAPHVRRGSLKKRERPTLTALPTGEVLVTGGFETTCRFDGEEDDHSCRDVELVDVRGHEVQDAGPLAIATHDHGVVIAAPRARGDTDMKLSGNTIPITGVVAWRVAQRLANDRIEMRPRVPNKPDAVPW